MLSEAQVFEFLGGTIDRDNLDEELLLFPQVAYAIAQYYKEAKLAKSEAKNNLDHQIVVLSKEAREAAQARGVKKTESAIAEDARSNSAYIASLKHHQEAEARFIAIDALTVSLNARESSYKLLVSLFNSSYWVSNTEDRIRNG